MSDIRKMRVALAGVEVPPDVSEQPGALQRLAARGIDSVTLLAAPAALFVIGLFIYPFLYGLWLSFQPKAPGASAIANYARFFADPFQYRTISTTLWLALPVTLLNVAVAVPIALRVRLMRHQRLLTTMLGPVIN
jgi:putative spermidine/putrescine transport system permease protein